MGHNLGMYHDFKDGGRPYTNCRKHSDGSTVRCNACANYQSNNRGQPLGPLTGSTEDCCNGFMGYYNHPHYWSDCSVRFFQQHYVAENWENCMESRPGNICIPLIDSLWQFNSLVPIIWLESQFFNFRFWKRRLFFRWIKHKNMGKWNKLVHWRMFKW